MPGHSRSKNGVASACLCPGIHVLRDIHKQDVGGRTIPGHDNGECHAFAILDNVGSRDLLTL